MHTASASIDIKAGAAAGSEPTHVEGPFGTLDAQGFTVMDKGSRDRFPRAGARRAERGDSDAAPDRRRLRCCSALAAPAGAQQLDLSHGGPIDITSRDGIEWRQNEREVIARGDARAIRNNVTVTADRLTAWYRKKGENGAAPAAAPAPTTGLAARHLDRGQRGVPPAGRGQRPHLHPDRPGRGRQGDLRPGSGGAGDDRAGPETDHAERRDHRARRPGILAAEAHGGGARRCRGCDQRRQARRRRYAGGLHHRQSARRTRNGRPPVAAKPPDAAAKPADDPLAASGKLQRVEAFGHVSVRTPTDTVTGDRGVYVPDTGMARLAGNVQITRGQIS